MDTRLVSLWRLGTLGSEVSLYRSKARPRAASDDSVGGMERTEVEVRGLEHHPLAHQVTQAACACVGMQSQKVFLYKDG